MDESFKTKQESLDTKILVSMVSVGKTVLQPERKLLNIQAGNSGFHIDIGDYDSTKTEFRWAMHFMPEGWITSSQGNTIRYSRMFAAGFLSIINFLLQEKSNATSELSNLRISNSVTWDTNDEMYNFASRVIGEKYFRRKDIDFSNLSQKAEHDLRAALVAEGWPSYFNLESFLEDYKNDPKVADKLKLLADKGKIDDILVSN